MIDPDFLISLYFNSEGVLEQKYFDQLSEWIQESTENAERFTRIALLYRAIHNNVACDHSTKMTLSEQGDESVFDEELWLALAEGEKKAPTIIIPKISQLELPPKVVQPKGTHKVNKISLYFTIISSAAMLFVILFLKFAPQKQYSIEVATLVDQMNSKWAQSESNMKTGSRLWTNESPLGLEKGIVKVEFDDGVEVVIEGPAVFEIGRSEIFLEYGRLYSRVSQYGLGFTVKTPTSQFVDHGTEFGIQADINGSSQLHVIKGKVQLFAGSDGDFKTSQMVDGNNAVYYNANNGQVKTISIEKNAFARQVNSETGMVWRGQMSIDLADIIGGGNGWGTGQSEIGIDPTTGKRVGYQSRDRQGEGQYVSVPSDRYIDGVFVPQNKTAQVVSSKGHIFKECPPTNSIFFIDILTGSGKLLGVFSDHSPTHQLSGRTYGTPGYPAIFMHANLGVTFDLKAISADLPSRKSLTRITADAGLSSDTPRQGNAVVWVLVDGAVKFTKQLNQLDMIVRIDVPLDKKARFLTFVVTDGEDKDVDIGGERASDSDWCIIAAPRLEISNFND